MVKRPKKPEEPARQVHRYRPIPRGPQPWPPWRKPGSVGIVDAADARTERIGVRMHPDLRKEIELISREDGVKLSQWIEKVLVDAVNRRRGRDVVDRIGRYRTS